MTLAELADDAGPLDDRPLLVSERTLSLLREACDKAGVSLGGYHRRIVASRYVPDGSIYRGSAPLRLMSMCGPSWLEVDT